MAIFLTGSTGYIGGYVAEGLLAQGERLALLVRAPDPLTAKQRLWKSLQLHMDYERFASLLGRIDIYLGDLTRPDLGLEPDARRRLVRSMDSVIHCAASLNRRSARACFDVNLRGTLEVIKLAQAADRLGGLRRFSDVSTVAVAGHRKDEMVAEPGMIDFARSDYDPYARTKKFCEHLVHELLPDVPKTIFRPSIVLGDSRFPETTQFDMVRAFVWFAHLPVLPFDASWRLDIVPADYVSRAIVELHLKDRPEHEAYNLSAGTRSVTYGEATKVLARDGHAVRHLFVPGLESPFRALVGALAETPRSWGLRGAAGLIKVFLPYMAFNTVFDNRRVVTELGDAPAPFGDYAYDLLRFARDSKFTYPYRPWPADHPAARAAARQAAA